ncbi:MAG TPA: GNAT family N-acetyltransferase [Anaerolineales bacterium]|jgi:RimJ/RimL family protein N-acetyltransferase
MIETNRLFIRPFVSADFNDLYEYLSDPSIYVYEPGEPISLDEAKELVSQRSMGNIFWAVVLKRENKLIGHLYFEQLEPKERMTWELGYIFNPKYQRKGYASEASAALVEYGFAHYHAHRIMARCNPENPASWKLLEKIGFTREGHFRKNNFFRKDERGNPIWFDAYEYSMLETDI